MVEHWKYLTIVFFLLCSVEGFAHTNHRINDDTNKKSVVIYNEHNLGRNVVSLDYNNGILTTKLFKNERGEPLNNTIFVIQYNYTLIGDLVIPDNCLLKFEGGSIKGRYSITGNNTGIEAPLVKVFNPDVYLLGSWNVLELYPEWFGAVSDISFDSSTPISTCIKTAYRIKSSVKFKRGNYKVSGNNPCGLEIIKNPEPDILFSEERNLNIDFSNSHIYYYPSSKTDCFAFVGYLRSSVWENLVLHVCQTAPSHTWGDVFSTHFGKKGALHRFGRNTFKNMTIEAGHIIGVPTTFRCVFSIDCSGGEAQHHDDLSIFERISSSGFYRFYYTTNSNSVSLTFNECDILLNRDNTVLFDVDNSEWAGYNRFNNCHFTIIDCDKAKLVRLKSINQPYGVVYFNESRVEIRNTSTNWMYFDIENGKVYFNDFYSVNYSDIDKHHSYGRIKYGTVVFSESLGIYTPLTLVGVPQGYDNEHESLIFNHSFFIKDETHVVPYPTITYQSSNGVLYNNRYEALNSTESFGNVVVRNCSGNTPNVRDRWLLDYELNNSRVPVIDETIKVTRLASKSYDRYLGTTLEPAFNVPCDIVINKVVFKQNGYNLINQGVSKVGLYIIRNGAVIKTIESKQTPTPDMPISLSNDALYLKAGDQLRCALLKSDNTEISDNYSSMSYLEIEYKVANWIEDLKYVYSSSPE